ncbi:MAG: sugar lactone lactonase YvrE [Candidatus Azotimanducaceae bacterium]|jgi:sugar lactone lactonase YvrE
MLKILMTPLCLALILTGCGQSDTPPPHIEVAPLSVTVLASGANIAGANGINFSPDNQLYIASVVGSNITVIDPDSGAIVRRLGTAEGVTGPDDIAFGPDGSYFWTSILTGEVAGFNKDGERVVAAQLTPGVNPITFSDNGRLFVSQCFFGTGLFEIDPLGVEPARVIAEDLGPGCGLNGMDWGPDNRLYGPRWFTGEIVSFDVDSKEMRVEAVGFQTPAAVKFNSKGELHVLDTGTGEVFRLDTKERDGRILIATLTPGLDNFAFDKTDRLFVSSFIDGFIKRIEADGSLTTLQPGGMGHPGGITLFKGELVVADLNAIRFFDPMTGDETRIHRNILGVGKVGGAMNLAADGEHLILASWVDSDIRVWDPASGEIIERYSNLQGPVAAVRFDNQLIATEAGTGRVISLSKTGIKTLFSLPSPSGLVVGNNALYVTDRESGSIYQLGKNDVLMPEPMLVISGLTTPEGIALDGEGFIVVEGSTGEIKRISAAGTQTLLATIPAGTPAPSNQQPPSMVFNGVALGLNGTIYTTGETSRKLYKIM